MSENGKTIKTSWRELYMSVLEIKNLHVSIEDKKILKGVDLTINTGEILSLIHI